MSTTHKRVSGVIKRIYHQCAYDKGMFVIASLVANGGGGAQEHREKDVTTQYKFTVHAPVRVHDKIELFDATLVAKRKHGKDQAFWEYSAKTAKLILQSASDYSSRPQGVPKKPKSDGNGNKVLNWAAGLHVRMSKLEEEGIARIWPEVKSDLLKLASVPNLRTETGMQLLKASGATEEETLLFQLASQVATAGDGHTWYPYGEVLRRVGNGNGNGNGDAKKIVERALELDLLVQPERGKLALSYIHEAERDISRMIMERIMRPSSGNDSDDDEEEEEELLLRDDASRLNHEQVAAVRLAMRSAISVWTGPPGSGKTTALSALALGSSALQEGILFLAPTGKAVVRLREVTQCSGASRPMTVHRWIHQRPQDGDDGGDDDDKKPAKHKLVVVDEASMLDVLTFRDLLGKLHEDAHLVLVGDTDQLPSVGPGCVLRDLIEARVPHAQLSTVYRQEKGSHLADAIEAMRADPMCIPTSGPVGSDFWIENVTSRAAIASRLRALVQQYGKRDGSGVLVATFKNMDVEEFGKTLRPVRRPQAQVWKMVLACGDRVMQIRNVYSPGGSERLNGETGTVVGLMDDAMDLGTREVRVKFDVDGRIEVYRDDLYGTQETYEELSMAVPITIHKAQGSQADTMIYVVPSENAYESKNLVYTAISRAQKRCIVLGSKAAFIVAINRPSMQRRTMLAALSV